MRTFPNPFRFDREVSGDFFCGREADIKAILSHIDNGTNLIMFAKRRSGKSSLIKEVFENHLNVDILFGRRRDKPRKAQYSYPVTSRIV